MKRASERGFTVIEVMLFLGVTGALFIALMVGVNSNITQQRYRESVFNLSTLIQDQYSEVNNTRNDRDNNWSCNNGLVDDNVGGSTVARGVSSCVILGRAIEARNDGSMIYTTAVTGVDIDPNDISGIGDLEALRMFQPKASSFSQTENLVDWQSTLQTVEGPASTFSMLILRSPASGLIRVFVSDSELESDLRTMITESAATNKLKLCIQGDRGTLPVYSVNIDPRIASSDAVTVNEFDEDCS
jgi:type II secretory pathway pseudopilin PulG